MCKAFPVRLTGLDTAFLYLDRDVSPMHLGALAIFRGLRAADPGRVAALLADRAESVPRLRQRVKPAGFPLAAASWADDPGFCAKDHIQLHHLEVGSGPDGVAALAAELMVHPLARNRPLWEIHVIDGFGESRFAVLLKMHHAFGDGLNALEIAAQVLDEARPQGGDLKPHGPPTESPLAATSPGLLERLGRLTASVPGTVGGVIEQAGELTGMAASVLRTVQLPPPGSPLVVSSSGQRALALAQLDLHQVRRIRAFYGGTVNDALLAILAGALRDWLAGRGVAVDGLIFRAFIPVSRRARSGNRSGANQLSGYLCPLPIGEPDPGKRLLLIRRAMERNKAGGGRRGGGAIPLLADLLPPAVHRFVAPAAGQTASLLFDLMVTSIPLPGGRFTLDRADLEAVYPLAPLAAGQALVVGLSWYRDRAYVALLADRPGLPDVSRLAEAVPPAAAALEGMAT